MKKARMMNIKMRIQYLTKFSDCPNIFTCTIMYTALRRIAPTSVYLTNLYHLGGSYLVNSSTITWMKRIPDREANIITE